MATGRFQKLERPGAATPGSTPTTAPTPTAPPAEADAARYPEFLEMADAAYYSGDYKGALRHYSRALQADSRMIAGWVGQINALIALRQGREAEVWTNRGLELFPEEPTMLSQRARALAHIGDLKRAIGTSDYAMTKGASPEAWLARGEVLQLARNANARFCFDKAVELAGPSDWKVPFQAGMTLKALKSHAAAAEFLGIAAERNLRQAWVYHNLAEVLGKLNHTERALDAARHAHELDPRLRKSERLAEDIEGRSWLDRLLALLRR